MSVTDYVFVYTHPDRSTSQLPKAPVYKGPERFWKNFAVRTTKEVVLFAIKYFRPGY